MANTLHLKITSLDGLRFEGDVQSVACRTIDGDVAILPNHINYCSAIGMGVAKVVLEDGSERFASCVGGMLSMMEKECTLCALTWEWSDEIDLERAKLAKEKAEKKLSDSSLDPETTRLYKAKLMRSLVRINTAQM